MSTVVRAANLNANVTGTDVGGKKALDVNVTNSLSTTPGPVQFVLDGTDTEVELDTGTPANSKPLPVTILDSSGDPASFASETTLASLEGKDFATETTLAAAAADIALIEGKDFATETTLAAAAASLASIEAEDFATETTLAAAALSLASLASEDFATETTLAAAAADLNSLEAKDFATETTLAAASAKLPATLGQKTAANSLAVVLASDQGAQPAANGRTALAKARHDYSGGNVTTGAYTELVADVGATQVQEIEIFDSSGQTLFLAVGAAASEVDQIYIVPGGNGRIPLQIAANARLSIKAVSANATAGEIVVNLYG